MMGRSWCVAGALIGVAACSAPPVPDANVVENDAPDSGEDAESDAGAGSSSEAAIRLGSSASPVGQAGLLDEAGTAPVADAGVDAPGAPVPDGPWTVAVPADMPQVIDLGGPVLSAPVLQAVTFANYDLTAYAEELVRTIGSSDYWQQVTHEYGVGAASSTPPVQIAQGAPGNADDVEIQQWLATQIQTNPAFAPPSPGTLYVLFYPSVTNVTFDGLQSCFTMGAYHNSTVVGGTTVAYAVIPECTTVERSALQTTTAAAAHEIVEAATDPMPGSPQSAYGTVDPDHLYLELILGGGEVADLCAQWPSSFTVPVGLPFMVQRSWSNAAATAGRDPCQPELPGEAFFNAVPALTDPVTIQSQGQVFPTHGAQVAMGASRTFDVHLYAEADVGAWTVQAVNLPIGSSNLGFAWDQTTGQNGDTLHLTISVNGVDERFGGEAFLVESTQGSTTNYWVGYVGQ